MVVRRAAIGDEPTLRALRLQALTDTPEAFGSTLERELARTTADWQRWMSPGATFILDASGAAKGLIAGAFDADHAGAVQLIAMWVDPALRGTGAADALVSALLAWAAVEGARAVRLRVVKANERAIRFYERHGFRASGPDIVRPRDGVLEIEMARRPVSSSDGIRMVD